MPPQIHLLGAHRLCGLSGGTVCVGVPADHPHFGYIYICAFCRAPQVSSTPKPSAVNAFHAVCGPPELALSFVMSILGDSPLPHVRLARQHAAR